MIAFMQDNKKVSVQVKRTISGKYYIPSIDRFISEEEFKWMEDNAEKVYRPVPPKGSYTYIYYHFTVDMYIEFVRKFFI